jgi:hypothetical protein
MTSQRAQNVLKEFTRTEEHNRPGVQLLFANSQNILPYSFPLRAFFML